MSMSCRLRWRVAAEITFILILCMAAFQVYSTVNNHIRTNLTPRYRQTSEEGGGNRTLGEEENGTRVDQDDVVWFAQVSDLHISRYNDPGRSTELLHLCQFLGSRVRPQAMLLTGDLTDSKEPNFFGSAQFIDEWKAYASIVQDCTKIMPKTKILDIRGNHDAFDVISDVDKSVNFFLNYSSQGKSHPRSYLERVGRLAFVAIDATPVPGLKRPFNFIGAIAADEVQGIRNLIARSQGDPYRVYFGHYPTGTVTVAGAVSLRDMMPGGIYLCGHLHNFLGAANNMYAMHPSSGLLELELADWKDNRIFRIAAFDQGFLSISDSKFTTEHPNTIVMVTSPKNPLFLTHYESVERLKALDQIRVLVFSELSVKEVTVAINDISFSLNQSSNSVPLYSTHWDNRQFTTGLHKMIVKVYFSDHSVPVIHRHIFSLDGSQPKFGSFSSFLLLLDWLPFMQVAFAGTGAAIVLILVIFRLIHHLRLGSSSPKIRMPKNYPWIYAYLLQQIRKFWMLSALDRLCYPLVGCVLYTCFMPWCLGRLMEGRWGLVFAWGMIFLDDLSFSPPDMTFAYGTLSFVFVIAPFLVILANRVDDAYKKFERSMEVQWQPGMLFRCLTFPFTHLGVILILILQVLSTRELYFCYGPMAAVSPWGVGRICFTVFLYQSAIYLTKSDFFEIYKIWPYC